MLKHSAAFSGFSVDDLATAKKFYTEVLGIDVQDNPMGLIELNIAGGYKVIVYSKPNHTPATFTILNFRVENIEDAVAQLARQGVKFEQYDSPIKTDEKGICHNPGGPNIAWFKDPAGNILSIIEQK